MPSLESIKADLSALDSASQFVARREINELPNILWDGEHKRAALQGLYGGGQELLLATDRRLIFVDKKMIGNRVKVEDFPYDKVSSIQYQTKMLTAVVTIFASDNEAEVEQIIPKHQARAFCESARAWMTEGPKEPPAPEASSVPTPNPQLDAVERLASGLERLAALRDKGLLSDAEFEDQKSKLLAGLS